jgi:hypothetical protein
MMRGCRWFLEEQESEGAVSNPYGGTLVYDGECEVHSFLREFDYGKSYWI